MKEKKKEESKDKGNGTAMFQQIWVFWGEEQSSEKGNKTAPRLARGGATPSHKQIG